MQGGSEVNPYPFKGLNSEEILTARSKNPTRQTAQSDWKEYAEILWHIVSEPMFLILISCATIYLLLGEKSEALFMAGAILLVSAISLYQEFRQKNALDALRHYHKKGQKVIRNNAISTVDEEDLVLGDVAISEEGDLISADGMILQHSDFSVNESLLTGESMAVYKNLTDPDLARVFQGSLVTSGQCLYRIEALGHDTRLGQIGIKMDEMKFEKSPLQKEISTFVTRMAIAGGAFFVLIFIISYFKTHLWSESLLTGLTIAMSVLPEEIPVAYSVFMALGAFRLIRNGIIVKKTDTVEALGNTHFLCLDKTGTITENRMELTEMYDFENDRIHTSPTFQNAATLLEYAMWASEAEPFDTMEISILQWYNDKFPTNKRSIYTQIHEYPLSGTPPSMTHVFEDENHQKLAAMKGAMEAVLKYAKIENQDYEKIIRISEDMTSKGYRVLGVAKAIHIPQPFPENQGGFTWQFLGLLAFYDPPKTNIDIFLNQIKEAGIAVKIITGDHLQTAVRIAKLAGLSEPVSAITQKDLESKSPQEFNQLILQNQVFARVSPEWKLKIIHALKEHGIVAMTGDGVNDGLALKASDVGIAMGKKGTEIAKLASSIVLTDDNIEKISSAIEMGRKIYTNLQKAIRYIISIHVPIILVVSIPIFLGWEYASIFSPIHIIFLELLMGPTCSIVYENEPPEPEIMKKQPIERTAGFISLPKLSISIVQGLVITLFALALYYHGLFINENAETIRSSLFLLLVTANIMLTLTNRSFYHSFWFMWKEKNSLLNVILSLTIVIMAAIFFIPGVRSFFLLSALTLPQYLIAIGSGLASVLWFEIYKWSKRTKKTKPV